MAKNGKVKACMENASLYNYKSVKNYAPLDGKEEKCSNNRG